MLSFDKKEVINDNGQNQNVQPEEAKGNVEYLKANGIAIDASIELLGDIEMYNQTQKDFIEESKTRIPRILRNKMSGNMKDYSIDVHAMKSNSKYLGFNGLAELSYQQELKSKEEDLNYVTMHFEELMDEYTKIKNIVDQYL